MENEQEQPGYAWSVHRGKRLTHDDVRKAAGITAKILERASESAGEPYRKILEAEFVPHIGEPDAPWVGFVCPEKAVNEHFGFPPPSVLDYIRDRKDASSDIGVLGWLSGKGEGTGILEGHGSLGMYMLMHLFLSVLTGVADGRFSAYNTVTQEKVSSIYSLESVLRFINKGDPRGTWHDEHLLPAVEAVWFTENSQVRVEAIDSLESIGGYTAAW